MALKVKPSKLKSLRYTPSQRLQRKVSGGLWPWPFWVPWKIPGPGGSEGPEVSESLKGLGV